MPFNVRIWPWLVVCSFSLWGQTANVNVTTVVSLRAGESAQFRADVLGSSNTDVSWSLNPGIGSISNGTYTAPSTVSSFQNVTIRATSVADSSKFATIIVSLTPPATITLSPSSATLGNGQVQPFKADVAGMTGAVVVWTINAAIGNFSQANVYTAPDRIDKPQQVILTAKLAQNPAISASTTISLVPDTTKPTVSLTSPSNGASLSGTVPISAVAQDNIGIKKVTFFANDVQIGSVGGPKTVYQAEWNTFGFQNGAGRLSVVAEDAAGNTATQTINVNVVNSQILLPIEVTGNAGATESISVKVSSAATAKKLWLRIHNLKYQSEASIRFNSGSWLPINDTTVTLQGLANNYGGIGGGASTLDLTMDLPVGALVEGNNIISFRFNGTDGFTSAFRVLAFNFLNSSAAKIVPASVFVQDDPKMWKAPSIVSADLEAGEELWRNGNLTAPTRGSIRAKCASCHAQDGRDLKYFNYSNKTIRSRAIYHGLTAQQGDLIASYIRSLNSPNPGRPWNPAYQPGPGMDSKPVEEWAAGAGLDAVLQADQKIFDYMPTQSLEQLFDASNNVSVREVRIREQLFDWNHWLPQVHPLDAWGDSFTNSEFNQYYLSLRKNLRVNDATSYVTMKNAFGQWNVRRGEMLATQPSVKAQGNFVKDNLVGTYVYSTGLWHMTKLWEIMQEFRLEDLGAAVFPKADSRSWIVQTPFLSSPNMMHVSPGAIATPVVTTLLDYRWYYTQLVLNSGQATLGATWPVDWPYVYGNVKVLGSFGAPAGDVEVFWLLKALQGSRSNGKGPEAGASGWNLLINDPSRLVHFDFEAGWKNLDASTRTILINAYMKSWLAEIRRFTPEQFYQGRYASPSDKLTEVPDSSNVGSRLLYSLPRLVYRGLDPGIANDIANWAQTVWPAENWKGVAWAPCRLASNLRDLICVLP